MAETEPDDLLAAHLATQEQQQIIRSQIEVVRLRLRELGHTLRRVASDVTTLAVQARLAWLFSVVDLTSPPRLLELLTFLDEENERANRWTQLDWSFYRLDHKEQAARLQEVAAPVQLAFALATAAVLDLVDEIRVLAPEAER